MNTRNLTVGAAILVVLLLGLGYYFYAKNAGGASASQNTEVTPGQVQAQEVGIGTGVEAKPGDTVSVLYIGQLQDGTVFDSSAAHDNQPLTFVLGEPGLIAGFQIGVNGMKVGGERLIAVPPDLGYGAEEVKDSEGTVIIPANAVLIFDIKLVDVKSTTTSSAAQ